MRSYGRTADGVWVEITDTNYIWLATVAQTLRLNLGESPFYAGYGIPAQASIMTQIAPDAAVARVQSQYGQHFSSLTVARQALADMPTYNVNAVFLDGTVINNTVVAT